MGMYSFSQVIKLTSSIRNFSIFLKIGCVCLLIMHIHIDFFILLWYHKTMKTTEKIAAVLAAPIVLTGCGDTDKDDFSCPATSTIITLQDGALELNIGKNNSVIRDTTRLPSDSRPERTDVLTVESLSAVSVAVDLGKLAEVCTVTNNNGIWYGIREKIYYNGIKDNPSVNNQGDVSKSLEQYGKRILWVNYQTAQLRGKVVDLSRPEDRVI